MPQPLLSGSCAGCGRRVVWLRTTLGERLSLDVRRLTVVTDEGEVVEARELHAPCGECHSTGER